MIFYQLRSDDGTGTLSYLIADENSRKGLLIDPNKEDLNKIEDLLKENRVSLQYIIDTHTHADHVSAASELKKKFADAKLIMHENTKNKWKIVDEGDKFGIGDILRENAKEEVDNYIQGNECIQMDSIEIKFLFTPGHTDNHLSVLINDMLFTGDLLLIGQAGRSDLPGGNTEEQFVSLYEKIIKLPLNTKIYPGHDYEDNEFSYLKDELESNPFLKAKNKNEYIEFVKDFFPPITDINKEGKAILQCGTKRVAPKGDEPFQNINEKQLAEIIKNKEDVFLLDVREPFELMAFGSVPGVVNIPTTSFGKNMYKLPEDKNKKIVVICQSGNRSLEVSHYLSQQGYKNIYNLIGGTSSWMYSNDPLVNEIKYSGTLK